MGVMKDAKHNNMVRQFKDEKKKLPILKKDLINQDFLLHENS